VKRSLLAILLACISVGTIHADTYPYLSFETNDGTVVSLSVSSLNMTFSNGKLIVDNGVESCEMAVKNLTRMFFSTTGTSGISNVSGENAEGNLEVFTPTGIRIGTFASAEAMRRGVKSGVYVVKSNGRTFKTVMR
jgi:hypothetical protein